MKTQSGFKKWWMILKEAISRWWVKDPFRESAIIAYYAIFSIPALLAIVVAIAAFFFGQEAVNGQISAQIAAATSPEAAKQVEGMIAKASVEGQSVFATIVGIITLLFGATGVLVQFQKSLNNIWEVKIDPAKKEWLHTIQSRLFSLGLIVTLGFLLLISMTITVVLSALSEWITQRFPDAITYVIEGVNLVVSVAVISVVFSMMYKILPDVKIKWRHVALGGLLTAILFVIGKFAIGFYFGKSDPASAYGAAGSVVLILLWVSYSSMIVFLGAEFTKAYVVHTGGTIVPKKNAVHVPGLEEQVARANSSDQPETAGAAPPGKYDAITNDSNSRKWFRIAFLLWPVVSILFNIIPFLRRVIVRKIFSKVKNAEARVKSIRLSLLHHSCTITQFEYDKIGFATDETLDCSVESFKVIFDWKALWRGVLICRGYADGISVNIIKHKKAPAESTSLNIEDLQTDIPIILSELEIKNSRINYTDTSTTPDLTLDIDDIRVHVTDVATVAIGSESLPTALSVRAHIYEGFVTIRLKANLLEQPPAFDIDAELVALNMVHLNDFFKAFGKFDVHKGTLGFFAEIAAKDGSYKGYVKPVIRNLDVLGPEEQHDTVLTKIWEGAIALASTTLKNQRKDQLATKVPFEGKFTPKVNVWHAMIETLTNAFASALKPSIDYEININSVDEQS